MWTKIIEKLFIGVVKLQYYTVFKNLAPCTKISVTLTLSRFPVIFSKDPYIYITAWVLLVTLEII